MESFEQVLENVKAFCEEKINITSYTVFFSKLLLYEWSAGENLAVLQVQNDFQQDVLSKRYMGMLKEGFHSVLGFGIEIKVIVKHKEDEPEEDNTATAGNYALTFENFIKGDTNSLALAAAYAVSQKPAADNNNPLFIYGDSGLGKTHLLTAISLETKKNYPGLNIIMADGEMFTNEIISAIQNSSTAFFHSKYREADVLLVDDIQFIGGKETTQEEFFHTFNTLHKLGKQLVLVSDRPPKEIRSLHDRLKTRFQSGLIVDIQPPKYETRVAIVRRKAELLSLDLPDDVVDFIATKLKNNIRQLEGAVKKINAYKKLEGIEPSIGAAQNAIKDILNEIQPVPITIDRIISEISRTFNVSGTEIKSSVRKANVSNARKLCMYIVQQTTELTTTDIGAEFGGRDHSTVVYSIQDIEKKIARDKQLRGVVDDIIKNVKSFQY